MRGTESNRSKRSAAVGPATAACGSTGDVENQAAFVRGIHVAVTGTNIPNTEASADNIDSDPGTDGVDTQISVFNVLKLVSPHITA